MGKQPEKSTTNAPGQFFVFGIDADGKPRGARFTEFNERALRFALGLGLTGVHPASPKFSELATKLPPGRLYTSGKGFIPNIRRDLVKSLNAVLASPGDESQKHQRPATAPPTAAGLPRSWDQIAVGQLVLATGDEPQDGFWECIVEGREDQILILRLRDYLSYIKLIEDEFGDLPLAALADRRVRGEFKAWRDKFANTPRKADFAWTVLARILSFAKDRGIISVNPCEKGGRLYVADRRDKIWTEDNIAALLSVGSEDIQAALMLAIWTGQRQGDLLRLPWSAYDGSHIRLRQSKTGRRIAMPAGAPLKALLDATERRGPLILTNSLNKPWTSDGFRTSWGKACDRAGITGLTFHDLRGTAVVRLAIAGATVPQIATFTGHSLRDVEAILDAHYLGRDIQLAEAAVLKLEARTKL